MIRRKKGFQFSFAWMFAIIVGAVILFLAIYAATRIVDTEREVQDTEIGREIGILLSPIETNLEDARSALIILPRETRLFNECNDRGNFGSQDISISTKSGIGGEWQQAGVPSRFYNKYLFSSNVVQGEKYRVFVKPFKMPFKVADLMFIWNDKDKYCFVNPPNDIEDEINELRFEEINVSLSLRDCEEGTTSVCFSTGKTEECDIDVDLDAKKVTKNFQSVYYEEALIYGAIFADIGIYECQVKRLMKRTSELSSLYLMKSEFLTPRDCGSGNLQPLLIKYTGDALNVSSSFDLRGISHDAQELERKNENLECKLF